MGLALLAAFGLTFLLCALLGTLVRPLARRVGFVDRPDLERKLGREAIPYGGGIAMLLGFAGGTAVLAALAALPAAAPWLRDFAPGLAPPDGPGLHRLLLIGAASLAVFAAGMVDDARRLRPAVKLACQAAAALALAIGGVRVTALIPSYPVSVTLTVIWVVSITNAFNFLDNMDGLSGGTAAISAFVFAMVAAGTGQPLLALLLALLAGSAAGFLVHNVAPARLYMGDAGSNWLGFTLSALTVEATFFRYGLPEGSSAAMLALGVPLLIMAVPIFDAATVIWIRLREGRPPWVGDRSHLSHRLVELGLSPRQAVLAIWLLALACGLGALFLRELPAHLGAIVLAQAAAILAVVAILEGLGRRRAP